MPPCGTCPKIPRPLAKGQVAWWGLAEELTDQNWRCYQHYLECRAVNWQVGEATDPIVRHHAAVIREIEDIVARSDKVNLLSLIVRSKADER